MKKMLIINILGVIIVIFLCEVLCFGINYKKYILGNERFFAGYKINYNSIKTIVFDDYYKKIRTINELREPEGLEYKKNPIVIFGCSFAFGDRLQVEDTFSYKLARFVKRPVFNFASCGWSFQHMLYILRKNNTYKIIGATPPVCIIYVYMNQHMVRLFNYSYTFPFNNVLFPVFKERKNELSEYKMLFPFLYRTNIFNVINMKYSEDRVNDEKRYEDNFNLMKLYFYESRKEIQKHYGSSPEFVILKYYSDKDELSYYEETQRWSELEDDGFIILDTGELIHNNKEDFADDGFHPSGEAWNKIIPGLVEKLSI